MGLAWVGVSVSKVFGCCADGAPEFGDIGGDVALGAEPRALPAALLLIAAVAGAACCIWSPLGLPLTRGVGDEPKPSGCCGRCCGGGDSGSAVVVVDSDSKADMIQAASDGSLRSLSGWCVFLIVSFDSVRGDEDGPCRVVQWPADNSGKSRRCRRSTCSVLQPVPLG